MINLGKRNILAVARAVDFGVYVSDEAGNEVLLPARYVDESMSIGSEVDVFVYNDSEDRLVATTEVPLAMVNEVAYLEVVDAGRIGAFLDWGLAKDLLVPLREQKTPMRVGKKYPVYIYLDNASGRIVASAKIEKFLGNVIPRYKRGDRVNIMIWKPAEIGMQCVVDNLHKGMLYDNQTFRFLQPGMKMEAWVSKVRDDGKIDLRLDPPRSGRERSERLADTILRAIADNHGVLELTDRSSPDEIKRTFQCSKRDFKQAVGHLLKSKKIEQTQRGLILLTE